MNSMNLPKNIFLVEDDPEDQLFFIEAISQIKNAILYGVASNGKEALDVLENSVNLPEIIFLDINMPLMNGIECLTEIMKNPKIKNIPVVIFTTEIGQMELARKLGAKAIVKKTYDGKILRKQLEEVINSDFIAESQ